MGIGDLLLGIVCVLLSGFVYYYSGFFPRFTSGERELPGPSFFPRFLSLFILIFGLFFIVQSLYFILRRKKGVSFGKVDIRIILKFLGVLSTGFLFGPVLSILGAIPGLTAMGIFLMRLFKVRWSVSVIYSLGLALFINWMFKGIFKMPLPDGKLILFLREVVK